MKSKVVNSIFLIGTIVLSQISCSNRNSYPTVVKGEATTTQHSKDSTIDSIIVTDTVAADTMDMCFQEVDAPLTYQRMFFLISCIPDKGLELHSKAGYTKAYYSLLEEAFAMPSDAPFGYIGSEEWLYYFISGNGGPAVKFGIDSIKKSEQKAVVYFSGYREWCSIDGGENHILYLVKENGQWIIADFDNTKDRLYQYIKTVRTYFRTQPWEDHFRQLDGTTEEDIDMRRREVEQYFKNYPNDR